MNYRSLSILFLSISITGCAKVVVDKPIEYNIEKSKNFSVPYSKAWSRAVDWFADHNVDIDKISKESGLITAKYALRTDNSFLDCGKMDISGTIGTPQINRSGTLNVTVRESLKKQSKVRVNFFGSYQLTVQDALDGRFINYHGDCVSTGAIEKSIFDYIQN